MRNISLICLLFSACISIICSLLTLFTIIRVKRWNGYTLLIFQLSLAQLLYDLSTLLVPLPGELSYSIYVGYRSIFGMSTTLLTNVITLTVVYTVFYFKAFEVSKHLNSILPFVYLPSLIIGLLVGIYVHSDKLIIYSSIYYWVRVCSISFNILSYLFVTFILKFPSIHSHIHTSYQLQISQQIPFSNLTHKNSSNDPLRAFVKRFQYYPLTQVICRVGVSWYEYVYGYSYNYHSSDSLLQKILIFFYVLFLPSLGTFYFIIYLNVSPNSYKKLSTDLSYFFRYICSCGNLFCISNNQEKQSNNSNSSNNNNLNNNITSNESISISDQRSTILSLYRPFIQERQSSIDRREIENAFAPFHRSSNANSYGNTRSSNPTSRQVSSDDNQSIRYEDYGEEELSREISRVYELKEKDGSSRSTFN